MNEKLYMTNTDESKILQRSSYKFMACIQRTNVKYFYDFFNLFIALGKYCTIFYFIPIHYN